MKVVQQSDSLLVIEDRPWFLGIFAIAMTLIFLFASMAMISGGDVRGGLFMGIIGCGLPLLLAVVMVRRVRLTFDRRAGRISRTSRSVFGLKQEHYPLDRLVDARVGLHVDSESTTHRTELRLKDPAETLPFTRYYSSGTGAESMARAVNQWLAVGGSQKPGVPRVGNR